MTDPPGLRRWADEQRRDTGLPYGGPTAPLPGPTALALPGAASMVARSMAVSMRLLPLLSRIVRPVSEFFLPAAPLVDRIAPLLAPGQTVLDLGCGKGGIAQRFAAKAPVLVTGVDAHAPFIEAARRQALGTACGERCTFLVDDVTAPGPWMRPADLVLALGVGPVYGALEVTLEFLATLVNPGGTLVWGRLEAPGAADRVVARARAVLNQAGLALYHVQTDWSGADRAVLADRARVLADEVRALTVRSSSYAPDLDDFAKTWTDGVPRPGRLPVVLTARRTDR
ncbi:MAG: methyltransferase domain-containing protein [Rhodospirillaceae bacterium]|nr:methyltransferase domain-containing protein [Rhodospirillaceae bacterium]